MSPIDTGQPPPSLARVFPRYENAEDSRWGTAIGHRMPGDDNRFASGPSLHVIVDGDTLDSLAKQYLGDASRAREIFEANRHILTDPNALPIGVELEIPSVSISLPVPPEGLVPKKPLVPVLVPR
ncbi:MAG: tail protein X [Pirellulales bacterium]|nr:tail protein X [Pirellulales bacterium]